MKKSLLLLCIFSLAQMSFAQKTTPGTFNLPRSTTGENYNSMVIPKEYAYNNKPLLTFTDKKNSNHIMVYDENIELIKSFDIDNDKEFNYTLTYQKESRDVKVAEADRSTSDVHKSFSEWLEQEKYKDVLLEQALIIKKQENGDSIICFDYSKSSYSYTSNSEMYFGYNYFGMKYPKFYYLASNGLMYQCRVSYTATYSEWKPTGETEEVSYSKKQPHISLYNLNLDNGGGTNGTNGTYFEISQTLFNQDEDYEYLIPKYALVNSDGSSSDITADYSTTYEDIVITRSTITSDKSLLAMVGFQVVSSSGNIVKEINFDDGFYIVNTNRGFALLTIGGNRYITVSNGEETLFYKVDNQSTDIMKVKSTQGSMFLETTVTGQNSTINVTLGDANEKGSDIMVTSASGMKINSVNVPAGQTDTQMSINAPSGMYCVSRIQNGKVKDSKKVMVK